MNNFQHGRCLAHITCNSHCVPSKS